MPPIRSSHDDKENHRPAGGSTSPPSSRRGRRPAHADRAARERRQARSDGAPRSIARRVAQVQRDVDAARATAEHVFGGGSVLDMPREHWVDILQRMRVGLQNSTIGAHVPLPPPALQEGAMDQLISGFDTMDLDDAATTLAASGGDGESRRRRIQTKRDLTDLTAELRRLQF